MDVRSWLGRRTLVSALWLPMLSAVAHVDALAQEPGESASAAIREACRADYRANCAGTPLGAAAIACLRENAARLSPGCQTALKAASPAGASGPAPSPAAASASPTPAAPPGPDAWPHTVAMESGGSAVVYQPQVISWPERRVLNARIAIGITPAGAKDAILGVIEVAFATTTALASRTVNLTEPRLTSTRFPSVDTAQAARFEQGIRAALDRISGKAIPLDTLLVSLREQSDRPPEIVVKNDRGAAGPPVITPRVRLG